MKTQKKTTRFNMKQKTTFCRTRLTLLEKIRDKHDDVAWADFTFYYRKYIYNITRRMGLNHHDAEEVVQTVIIKSWDKLPEFQYDSTKGRFRGWLCRVTGNAVKTYYRDHKKRFVEYDALESEHATSHYETFTESEIDQLADQEWEEYIPELAWKNIEKHFDSNVRQVFYLIKEKRSVSEIAQQLGIADSSVYVYKKRIQDKLHPEMTRLRNELG